MTTGGRAMSADTAVDVYARTANPDALAAALRVVELIGR